MGFFIGSVLPGTSTRATKGNTRMSITVNTINGSLSPPTSSRMDAIMGPIRKPTISQAASFPSISPALPGSMTKANRRIAGRTAPAPKPSSMRAISQPKKDSATHIQAAPIMLATKPNRIINPPWPRSARLDNSNCARNPAKNADPAIAPMAVSEKPKLARISASSVKTAA